MLITQLLEYFNIKNAGDLIWSHAINSKEKLERCLKDENVMVIESDIRMSDDGIVIAAHPPVKASDLRFDELIEKVSETRKGIKLDFKDAEVLDYCFDYLNKHQLSRPVILNTDILCGNNANEPKVSADYFIKSCFSYYPQGILSLGWTTVADTNFPYTKENVKNMLDLCDNLESDILLPIRACLLPNSWETLKEMLNVEKYWLSLWNNEPIDSSLLSWIKTNTDYKKTFYDFINNGESVKLI